MSANRISSRLYLLITWPAVGVLVGQLAPVFEQPASAVKRSRQYERARLERSRVRGHNDVSESVQGCAFAAKRGRYTAFTRVPLVIFPGPSVRSTYPDGPSCLHGQITRATLLFGGEMDVPFAYLRKIKCVLKSDDRSFQNRRAPTDPLIYC